MSLYDVAHLQPIGLSVTNTQVNRLAILGHNQVCTWISIWPSSHRCLQFRHIEGLDDGWIGELLGALHGESQLVDFQIDFRRDDSAHGEVDTFARYIGTHPAALAVK